MAKGDRSGPGVCDYGDAALRARAYPDIPLGEVWGMGRASVAKLAKQGIKTVDQFVAID